MAQILYVDSTNFNIQHTIEGTFITPYLWYDTPFIHEFFHFIWYMIAAIAFFFGIGRFGGHPCGGKLNNDYNHWWWNYWNYCINYTEEMMAKKADRKCRWFWGDQPAIDDFLSGGVPIPVHQDTVLDAKEGIVGLGTKLW